jgi:hypothetical protein
MGLKMFVDYEKIGTYLMIMAGIGMLFLVPLIFIAGDQSFDDAVAKQMVVDRGYTSVRIDQPAPMQCAGRYQTNSRYFVAKRTDGRWARGVLCAGTFNQNVDVKEYKVY